MASWIESHTVLLRHRKLSELARSLRLKPVHCLGHLHVLWHAALEQQEDGDLSKWSDEFIAEQAAYSGDAPQFVSLLQLHGWLDGKLLHDWLDYAGRYLRGRYSAKNRERLVEIWAKHGKVYGEQRESEGRVIGDQHQSTSLVGYGNGLDSSEGGEETARAPERAPPKVDGTQAGYHTFELPTAREVVKAYQLATGSSQPARLAINVVAVLLGQGAKKESLITAAKNWGKECRAKYSEPARRMGAKTFYGDGHWVHYLKEESPVDAPEIKIDTTAQREYLDKLAARQDDIRAGQLSAKGVADVV